MIGRNRCDVNTLKGKGFGTNIHWFYAGFSGIFVFLIKRIGKAAPHLSQCPRRSKKWHFPFVKEVDRADIVEPHRVVIVLVREQNGMYIVELIGQHLMAE